MRKFFLASCIILFITSCSLNSNKENKGTISDNTSNEVVTAKEVSSTTDVTPISSTTDVTPIIIPEEVDLGLSVKWASFNLGAASPTDCGEVYGWGEKTDVSYRSVIADAPDYQTYMKDIGDISGDTLYDVARIKLGGSWRIPTKTEMQELIDKCTWEYKEEYDIYGYRITSKINGESIFLPDALVFEDGDSDVWNLRDEFHYWTSTPDKRDLKGAYYLHLDNKSYNIDKDVRISGHHIRPVTK